ncbi:MAG: TetR/AcrR family transcriptional regulator [Eubacteriaceae bacterium]|jgi:AcrR family transcriptional regulator|nr:hypothetical protein [Eubacteriaceae bacterium]
MAEKKKPEERKNEILDISEKLFKENGYERTSIEQILKELKLSKGGFYHHFKSKEEVLDGIIKRFTDLAATSAQEVVENPDWDARQKMIHLLAAIRIDSQDELLTEIHRPENNVMHLKSLLESTKVLVPYFGQVARQGIEEGHFKMEYPDEVMEGLFLIASIWFDEGFFDLSDDQKFQRAAAFMEMAEKCTGDHSGMFQLHNIIQK